ncbi:MAG: CoA-binding protein [Burkholderiaceae bacterium]|nr:CoA-binding protein [Burkholderiaceae bacterium]
MTTNMTDSLTASQLTHILQTCRTIAVVGLSPKPDRASYEVSQYMQAHGYRIVPVNPVAAASNTPILGEKVYASLSEAAQAEKIDMVDCFRNSVDIPPIAEEAINIGANVLWMQLGISHEASAAQAGAAGLVVVQNRCLLIEHRRLAHLL